MKKCLAITLLLLVSSIFSSSADTVYFKDGRSFDNVETKETEEGVWVGGILFEKSRIDKIEEKEMIKKYQPAPKESWWDKILTFFKKDKEKEEGSNPLPATQSSSSDFDERIRKQREEEKLNAEMATQQALQRAREATRQEELSKQEAQKKDFSTATQSLLPNITVKRKINEGVIEETGPEY